MGKQEEDFYSLLQALIGKYKTTQAEVARLSEVKESTLAGWANLKGNPRKGDQVLRVAWALKASKKDADTLLKRAGQKTVDQFRVFALKSADKDLLEIVSLWPVVEEGVPFQVGPLHTDRLIGRADTLFDIEKVLAERKTCVLRGMGGVGKTALATHYAHQAIVNYPDGVLWVDLSDTIDNEGNVQQNMLLSHLRALMKAYGRNLTDDKDHTLPSYQGLLRQMLVHKKALIIFDNVPSTSALEPLLPSSVSQCSVMILTRNKRVLQRKPNTALIDLNVLGFNESMDFLKHRMGDQSYRLEEEKEGVHKTLQLMDGLPLALEMVIPNIEVMTFREYVELIEDEQTRLQYMQEWGEVSNDLKAVFSVSFKRLSKKSQKVFSYLSLFKSNTFDAAAIGNIIEMPSGHVKKLLRDISDFSMIVSYEIDVKEIGENEATTLARFRIHDLMRVFALYQLQDPQELHLRMKNFAQYYAEFCQHQANQQQYRTIDVEWENIDTAIKWLIKNQEGSMAKLLALGLSQHWGGAVGYLDIQAKYQEAQMLLDWVQTQGLITKDPYQHADLLIRLGVFCFRQNKLDHAHKHLSQAQKLLANLPASEEVALLKGKMACYLASYYFELGKAEDAFDLLHESNSELENFDSILAQHERGYVLITLAGFIARSYGRNIDALALFDKGLNLLPHDPTPSYLKGVINLSNIHSQENNRPEAAAFLDKAIDAAQHLGDIRNLAIIQMNKAVFLQQEKKYESALEAGLKSLKCFKQIGHKYIGGVQQNLGRLFMILDRYAEGREILEQAIQNAQHFESLENEAFAKTTLAELEIKLEDYSKADELLLFAQKVCVERRVTSLLPFVLNGLALVILAQGNAQSAYETVNKSIVLAEESNNVEAIGISLSIRGRILDHIKKFKKAEEDHQQALVLLENKDAYEYEQAQMHLKHHYSLSASA